MVYVLPREHPSTQLLAFDVLGITPSAFDEAVERDQGNPHPTLIRVYSEVQMYRAVATTKGAIGYVGNTILLHSSGELVQVVPMNGRRKPS